MKTFFYTAHTAEGIEKRASLRAENLQQAKSMVAAQGMTVIMLEERRVERKGLAAFLAPLFARISLTERALLSQNLYIMIKSGMAITHSFTTLSKQTKNRTLKRVLEEIKTDIESGGTFAKALERHARFFSEVYINMIAAGEASGKLESVLQELSVQLKKERTLRAKMKSAMAYPVIVVATMILLGIALMIFVIPKMKEIYTEIGAKLPLPTQLLIDASDTLTANGIVSGSVLVAVIIALRLLARTKGGKRFFHRVVLLLPIAATIVKKTHLARFSRTLASLLTTDIPIVRSFTIIERTMANVHYREAMALAAESLKKGKSIAESLEQKPKLFPPMVTQMVSVGESSGKLDDLSRDLADFYETDVDETLSGFSTIIEPILLLLLGIGVAAIAVAVLLPIYSITENI